jgi:hypothetical protein
MLQAVALVLLFSGQPTHPGFFIETFETEKQCWEYAAGAGWPMARSTIGVGPAQANVPIKGMKLDCVTRI